MTASITPLRPGIEHEMSKAFGPITVQGKFDFMSSWLQRLRTSPFKKHRTLEQAVASYILENVADLAAFSPSNPQEAFYKSEGSKVAAKYIGDQTPTATKVHLLRMMGEEEHALTLVGQIEDPLTQARLAFTISQESTCLPHRQVGLGIWSGAIQKISSLPEAVAEVTAKLGLEAPDVRQEALGALELRLLGRTTPGTYNTLHALEY